MQHPYATDSVERERVPFVLAAIAVACAFGLHHLLKFFGVPVPWWIDSPSPLFLYGVLTFLFEKSIWNWRFVRKIGLVKVPYLAGLWACVSKSSYDQFASENSSLVSIEQTWTRMSIRLQSATSESSSLVAAILLDSVEGEILSYQYRSEPRADAVNTMQTHLGTTWLSIRDGEQKLDGRYYSGRGRQNHGFIILRRIRSQSTAKGTSAGVKEGA